MKRSALWIFGGLFLAGAAQSQPAQIQSLRPTGAENLSRNLSRLASNPRDVDALIGAGEAAIDMDDIRAAAGFFGRADAIQPNNGRVKVGLARVMLKSQNPAEALRLFDQATRLGVGDATLLADRGLARDMTGDQAGAQRDYQAALKRAPDDSELLYRYAASLGISGQLDAAEKVLQPLLYKSDRAAWRYRAFILAMNNKQADARKIANQTMPAQLAGALAPYMEKMPYLTPAQKAAAVHFGHFPMSVGTSMAAASPRPAVPTASAAVPQRPVPAPAQPAYQPPASANTRVQPVQPDRPAPAARAPVPSALSPARTTVPAPAPSSLTPSSPAPRSAEVQGPPAPATPSTSSQSPPPATAASQLNAISLAQASAPAAQQAAPTSARPQPNPEATRTLAEIIRAIDVPEAERQSTVAAVDLSEIEALQAARRAERQAAVERAKKTAAAAKAKADAAAKAKAEADAKAKKAAEEKARLAANPSRSWVQIGTGADRGALAFTLKSLRRKYNDVAPQDGWTASWGRTNRLLIGPFASFTRAKTVESKLKSAGADAFAWQSDAGEMVERLGAK